MAEHLNLLLVEDDPMDAELIVDSLDVSGFSVRSHRVSNERDLRAALARKWDVVLADFNMPGFDGVSAFTLCQERASATPFIFVSGVMGETQALTAMEACACSRVPKGDLDRLPGTIRGHMHSKHSAAARAAENALVSGALQASGAGIVEHRIPLGSDTYCSERWAHVLGYSPDELSPLLLDREWIVDQIHPDDVELVQERYEAFVTGAEERCELHLRVQHREGHWVPMAASFGSLARDADGCARHVVGVLLDLTEPEARRAHQLHADRMIAIGRLAGGIAHDFNNLLTAIIGFSSFAIEEVGRDHSSHGSLQTVLEASDRARSLTAQLLAFARRRPVAPEAVDVRAVIAEVAAGLRSTLGDRVRVETSVRPGTGCARVDPRAILDVLGTLTVNACDAMRSGGELTLAARNVDLLPGHRHPGPDGSPLPVGRYVAIDVTDTGVGIHASHQAEVFEPFYTTKGRGWATGLGLSTAHGLVAQAGGCLTVESVVGEGSTFTALLPRGGRSTAPGAGSDGPVVDETPGHVLVVDDNDIVRATVVRSLSRAGYRVEASALGSDALGYLHTVGGDVDLLLTDVVMPEMRGDELVDRAVERYPALSVLYMSGFADAAELVGGRRPPTPANTLYKPFTPDELLRRVVEHLRSSAAGHSPEARRASSP